MRRILIVLGLFLAIVTAGLWIKVRREDAVAAGAPGGSGVIEGVTLDIASRLSARIAHVHVREGQPVKAGELLVELECSEPEAALEAAKARLAAAESQASAASAQVNVALGAANAARAAAAASTAQQQAASATRELSSKQADRVLKLRDSGSVTVAEVDRVEGQLTTLDAQLRALDAQNQAAGSQALAARAQAEAARAQAAAARAAIAAAAADVRRAESFVAECRLLAPRDAVVETRAFEPGEAVLPGTRILRLVVLDPVEITFYLPDAELALAKSGQPARVVADALPGVPFAGTVEWISPEAEFTPRNVQTRKDRDRLVYAVRVQVPNADRRLRVGMPVEVTLE